MSERRRRRRMRNTRSASMSLGSARKASQASASSAAISSTWLSTSAIASHDTESGPATYQRSEPSPEGPSGSAMEATAPLLNLMSEPVRRLVSRSMKGTWPTTARASTSSSTAESSDRNASMSWS